MSPLAKHFIEQGIKLMQINEYLRSELVRAGFAGVDIQKTPLGVRITLRENVFKRLRISFTNVLT